MAIRQPQSTDTLNLPDHALSHRVFANDNVAPDEAIVIDSNGYVGIGTTGPVSRLTVFGTGSGFPATSGTTQSAGLIARLKGAQNNTLDIGGNGGSGMWLQ